MDREDQQRPETKQHQQTESESMSRNHKEEETDCTTPTAEAAQPQIYLPNEINLNSTNNSDSSKDGGFVSEEDNDDLQTQSSCYLTRDSLLTHLRRQSLIVKESLRDRLEVPVSTRELSAAYERNLFSPATPPRREANGTCEKNPRVNFYPPFAIPEVLATHHIFFQNLKIPVSCRANRTRADELLMLKDGDVLPGFSSLEEVSKIFEGLGSDETPADNALENKNGVLIELKGDNPRLAVLKRTLELSHFAYPALCMPPKVMSIVMDELITRKSQGASNLEDVIPGEGEPAVSDEELIRWLRISGPPEEVARLLEERRKTMMAVTLVTACLECMRRFFTTGHMIRKLGETLHYAFRQGYVRLASQLAGVNLDHIISYLGILHENRLGQSVLQNTLRGEARRDYVRDTIYLFLVYTWQGAMGVWQQCLEESNLRELSKLLRRARRSLWTGFSELAVAQELSSIIFPQHLIDTLQKGLPDLTSQSMMHNFRSFILERSGILPAVSNALPSDFLPISFKECPPPLWVHVYALRLANFLMHHSDLAEDCSGEGLLECYCRCNLCTPHRCLATNPALLNETQAIDTFEIRGPGTEGADDGTDLSQAGGKSLKLTAGLWASAFLRKFEPSDYHAYSIQYYENQSRGPNAAPSACVITNANILAQLQEIKRAREEFLLKKGHGVYLDPQTGEELNTAEPSVDRRRPITQQHESISRVKSQACAATTDELGTKPHPGATQETPGDGRSVRPRKPQRRQYVQRGGGRGALRHPRGSGRNTAGGEQGPVTAAVAAAKTAGEI